MKPAKEKVSITIDSKLLSKLKEDANQECRSLSQYINLILTRFLSLADTENTKEAK